MELIRKINKVKWFVLAGESLFYNSKNQIFDQNNNSIFESEIDLQEVSYDYPYLYISDIIGNSTIITQDFTTKKVNFVKKILNNDLILVSTDNGTEFFDIKSNQFEKFLDFKILKFITTFTNIYIIRANTSIVSMSLNKKNLVWELNAINNNLLVELIKTLSITKFKILQILCIWQSELLVACSDGLILSIDIETGTLKRSWQEIPGFAYESTNSNTIPKAESFVLHGDKLVGALYRYYFEIDLLSGEITFNDLKDEMEKFNLLFIKQVTDNPCTDEHFYLTAMMNKKEADTKFSYDCVIALNRQTFKIDWQYKFEEESLDTNIPKLSGEKLYQLDNGGTLHIFEKVKA